MTTPAILFGTLQYGDREDGRDPDDDFVFAGFRNQFGFASVLRSGEAA
jgi:hypothetical protein